MKKKVIMIGIIIVSAASLLSVLYYVKTKNIKYINSIEEISKSANISMTIDGKLENELPAEGYYKMSPICDGGNVSWSNISHKLKVKVTEGSLKCKLAFNEVTEDINIIAMQIDGVESNAVPTSGWYNTTYSCVDENNQTLSGTTLPIIKWDNSIYKLSISNIDKKIFCTVNFVSTNTRDFPYTKFHQTIILPKIGYYKLEVWGASGAKEFQRHSGKYARRCGGIRLFL